MLGDLNERAISLEEVREAVNEMRSGAAPGLDGFPVECLKKGGMAVLEWHLLGSHTVLGISVPGGVNFALFMAYSFSYKSS